MEIAKATKVYKIQNHTKGLLIHIKSFQAITF